MESSLDFHKILCIDCIGNIDVYKDITHTMEWVYMLSLHASNVMTAITVENLIVASILLACVAGRYYVVHTAF